MQSALYLDRLVVKTKIPAILGRDLNMYGVGYLISEC
jgi:hypothetical protein